MGISDELLEIEHELAAGSGPEYERRLADEAVIIIPGVALTKSETVGAMTDSTGWPQFRIVDPKVMLSGPDVGVLTYQFDGQRDDRQTYSALMTSVYSRASGDWKLLLHQQTPLG
jgi:hypothetical protein